jgi:hypothetical protein
VEKRDDSKVIASIVADAMIPADLAQSVVLQRLRRRRYVLGRGKPRRKKRENLLDRTISFRDEPPMRMFALNGAWNV